MTDAEQSESAAADTKPRNTTLAALGYLPVLFFLPLAAGRDDRFCRFHGFQSLVLFSVFILFWVVVWVMDVVFGRMMGSIFVIGFLFRAIAWMVHHLAGAVISLGYLLVMIAGLIQAAMGNYWRIPILGVYADRLSDAGSNGTK